MSDQGEKTCPLCAEEMDLTDQQLKPCKCGYEICVWCWHQIMDRAERNETQGRCPACRTPYNKEKIVGTAANCERLVSEINVEKRSKPQRGKSKAEGRRHLASVRVIQRHLVYVSGMPLHLADEDLLHRREYFGQYGKVLKVSISRTAAGAIQQFANSTCSVYITYSKEEEAFRCMQMVHGFVLDGRPLRACFGTTKYCHAWLRSVPCNNPDCLYLHEIGSQEDSFTKDEIVSGHTRDRLQQNTISFSAAQRRSGKVLPPPADDCCSIGSMSSGKAISKTSVNANNPAIGAEVSPPNSSSGRSSALPAGASWGTRASSNQPLLASRPSSSEQPKQKPDTYDVPVTTSNTVASLSLQSLQHDTGEQLAPEDDITAPQSTIEEDTLDTQLSTKQSPYSAEIADTSIDSDKSVSDTDSCDTTDENVNNLCSDISAMSINESKNLDNGSLEVTDESVFVQTAGERGNITEVMSGSSDVQCDMLSITAQGTQVDLREIEDDLLSFESQRVNDPEVSINRTSNISHAFHLSRHSNIHSSRFVNTDNSISDDLYRKAVDRNSDVVHPPSSYPSRNQENILNMNGAEATDVRHFNLFPCQDKKSQLGSYEGEMSFNGASNRGENSIISNILSMDFDPWNDSLTSSQNLVKLLGEVDTQQVSSRAPGPRRIQNRDQSRFLFAREEALMNQVLNFELSIDYLGKTSKQQPFGYDFSSRNSSHIDKVNSHSDLSLINRSESEIFASSRPHISSNKLSVARSPISPPPGFSLPNRAPPPGFAYHERTAQLLDNFPGNRTLDTSSLSRNEYHHQTPSSANVINNDGDIEFIDPAILAVGKGMVPNGFNSYGLDISQNCTQ